jgi:hypothetical protein
VPAVRFESEPDTRFSQCDRCDAFDAFTSGTVLVDGRRHALYSLRWHVALDAGDILLTLGSFHQPTYADQATFGGLLHVTEAGDLVGELVDAPHDVAVIGKALGRPLTREEARVHDRVQDFWYYLDWLLENDPVLLLFVADE